MSLDRAGRKPDPDAEYPEHEKLRALEGANNTVGDFIEWLQQSGYVLARYGAPYEVQFYVSTRELRGRPMERLDALLAENPVPWLSVIELAEEYEAVKALALLIGDAPGERATHEWSYIALADPEQFKTGRVERWTEVRHNKEQLWSPMPRTEKLIGEFFGIDQQKLSDEKDAMLDEIRKANAA